MGYFPFLRAFKRKVKSKMTTKTSVDDEINNTLITVIQEFTHLYRKDDPVYRDKQKKDNSSESIAAIVELNVIECQTRWKSLLDRYVREKKKIVGKSGQESIYVSQTMEAFLKSMSFLDTTIQYRKTLGNYPENVPSPVDVTDAYICNVSSDGTRCDQVYDEYDNTSQQCELITDFESEECSTPSTSAPRQKRRRCASNDIVNDVIINVLNTYNDHQKEVSNISSANKHFAMALAMELQRFSPRKKALVQSKILLLVAEHDNKELN